MRYLKKTFEYLFLLEKGKRFIILLLFSIPAGIVGAFVAPSWAMTDWARNFSVGNTSLWINWTLGGRGVVFWVAFGIALLIFTCVVAMMSTVISRNLRVGVFKVNRLVMELNEGFFPALYATITAAVAFLFFKLLASLLLVLCQTLENVYLSFFLSVAALLFVLVLANIALALGMLYLPIMTFNGIKPFNAIVGSVRKTGGRCVWKLMFSTIVPTVITQIIGCCVGLFQIPLLSEIVDGVTYTLLFCYIITLSMVSYYEVEEIKREDYPRSYFFKSRG